MCVIEYTLLFREVRTSEFATWAHASHVFELADQKATAMKSYISFESSDRGGGGGTTAMGLSAM